ncbi:sulfatase-like hydrolase/transferase [Alienimonas sp. DA493]|uniref:sulfatase-like hydrolase/transferase n=1 Tax=Alienimonas sp. DA493 TaxID=3373605 RepID=UPI003753F82A
MPAALLLLALPIVAPPATDGERPNVLLILCDDLGYGDLGCYGHPVIETPRLDALAAGGMRFTHFYSSSPVCSPSRAGLMTGRTPDRSGVYDWIPHGSEVHLRADEPTISSLLNDADYDTCHVGKWHLNGKFNRAAQPQPGDHGFDHWFATQNNASPSHRNPSNFVSDGEEVGDLEGYSCNLVAAEAIRWLDDRADSENPFYLNVWFHEPHEPIASPEELTERYETDSRTPGEAEYFANVANMDRAVGALLDALDERGLQENTVVIFTSDNGPETLNRYRTANRSYGSPGELRGMKLWLYEGGIRVPGIVSWPGRIAPRVEDEPVGAVDLLPTLCELTGTPLPEDRPLDGASLAGLLADEAPLKRAQPLFWSYYRALGGPVAALREGDLVLLGRRDRPGVPGGGNVGPASMPVIKATELGRFELYDTRRDLRQYWDLAGTRPEDRDRLADRLIELHRSARDEGPEWSFQEAE